MDASNSGPDMANDIAQPRGIMAASMVYWELELFAFSPLSLKPGVQFPPPVLFKNLPKYFPISHG